jgi:signal transduction histidine kinase
MSAFANVPETESASRRDLLLVGGSAALFWVLSAVFELNERMLAWTRPWERYQLDELPGVLLFLALALAWFAWRRVREAREQLRRRVEAETRLGVALAENRRLSLSHVRMQEEERKQLARELHDELGQHVNAIKIDAVAIRDWSDGQMSHVHGAACSLLQVTDHVQGIVRDLLRRLRPAGLDELGLSAALEHLAQSWRERNPATRLELNLNTAVDHLDERENITLYRIVQEGLTNVVKHAQAGHVRITLERDAQGILLTIADDGTGAAAGGAAAGFGLVGMRERVEALGGRFEIASLAGRGFTIKAGIPVALERA